MTEKTVSYRASRAAEADEYLAAAVETVTCRRWLNDDSPARQLMALAGIGQAVLALGETLDGRLADAADAVTDVRTQVAELGDTVRASRRGWWRRGAARPVLESADRAVVRQALADAAEWRRHESESGAGKAPVMDERLAHAYLALRERLGGGAPAEAAGRGDGTGVSAADVIERAARVPEVIVPRYAAPRVTVTPVTTVISPEPVAGRREPGHYQQVMLDTRTGELRFCESAEHLEAPGVDVAWERWHPGKLFVPNGGPHMWFEPVPGLLYWVVDSGRYVPGRPYLDAAAANALLGEVAPYAQALLDGLFDTGELDWSAASAAAARHIERLCSRERQACGRTAGLADYADIVARLPQVYRPGLLQVPPGKLAAECESITRFLGCNEHWHPEVKETFGTPYSDGSGLHLDTLGVRAWYRAAAGAMS